MGFPTRVGEREGARKQSSRGPRRVEVLMACGGTESAVKPRVVHLGREILGGALAKSKTHIPCSLGQWLPCKLR